MDFSFLSWE